jgi:hypothetical protein
MELLAGEHLVFEISPDELPASPLTDFGLDSVNSMEPIRTFSHISSHEGRSDMAGSAGRGAKPLQNQRFVVSGDEFDRMAASDRQPYMDLLVEDRTESAHKRGPERRCCQRLQAQVFSSR